MALQRSPPKMARFALPGSTATVRLYQLCTWPRFIVRQPDPPSPASVVGFVSVVAVTAGVTPWVAPTVRPVAIRVQVLPPSVLFRYAAVAFAKVAVKPGIVAVVSCAALACAYSTVVVGSAVGPAAKLMRPMSVTRLPVTEVGRPPAWRIDVQFAPPSVLFQKSP